MTQVTLGKVVRQSGGHGYCFKISARQYTDLELFRQDLTKRFDRQDDWEIQKEGD